MNHFASASFALALISLLVEGASGLPCCKDPQGTSCWDVPEYDIPPNGFPTPGGNDCALPPDPNVYYVPTSWTQERPWSSQGALRIDGPGNGWAIDPRSHYGCMVGGWCPYACQSPYIESQFDNYVGQPWTWDISCNGMNYFIGAGRRFQRCTSDMNPMSNSGSLMCAGGQQGLHCESNGVAAMKAPSSQQPLNYTQLCIRSPDAVIIQNDTPFTIQACRTVFPGSEIPQIPTEFPPGSSIPIPVPPVMTSSGVSGWWTAGLPWSSGLQFYLMRPERGPTQCLTPTCQWIVTRPGTDDPSIGGIDYTPYIIEISPSASGNQFDVAVRLNCDASVERNSGYAGALGNPGYGVQMLDQFGNPKCNAYWTGPIPAPENWCNTLCSGWGCANNQTCAGSSQGCAQTPYDCSNGQCSGVPVQPQMSTSDGVSMAEGTALRNSCVGGTWSASDPNRVIKIRLYPTS